MSPGSRFAFSDSSTAVLASQAISARIVTSRCQLSSSRIEPSSSMVSTCVFKLVKLMSCVRSIQDENGGAPTS